VPGGGAARGEVTGGGAARGGVPGGGAASGGVTGGPTAPEHVARRGVLLGEPRLVAPVRQVGAGLHLENPVVRRRRERRAAHARAQYQQETELFSESTVPYCVVSCSER